MLYLEGHLSSGCWFSSPRTPLQYLLFSFILTLVGRIHGAPRVISTHLQRVQRPNPTSASPYFLGAIATLPVTSAHAPHVSFSWTSILSSLRSTHISSFSNSTILFLAHLFDVLNHSLTLTGQSVCSPLHPFMYKNTWNIFRRIYSNLCV